MNIAKWFLTMMFNLFGLITAPIIFPIAYLLRDISIVRNKILWIYFDDEDEFGYDVYWWMRDKSRNFLTAYKWCAIRNPMWNGHTLSTIKENSFVFLAPTGFLQRNGKILEPTIYTSAVLKYVNENDEYMDNKGEYLSLKHSIIGSQYVEFYSIKTRKDYWRYSYANKLISNIWVEIQMGYTTRATFRLKIKRINKIK